MASRRLKAEEREHALARVEALLLAGVSHRKIDEVIMSEFQVRARKTVRDLVAQVRERWRIEGDGVDREQRRDEYRAYCRENLKRALSRKKSATVKRRGADGSEWQEVVKVDDPDLQTAQRCIETLCRLDGTFRTTIELEFEGSAEKLVEAIIGALSDYPEAQEKAIAAAKAAVSHG